MKFHWKWKIVNLDFDGIVVTVVVKHLIFHSKINGNLLFFFLKFYILFIALNEYIEHIEIQRRWEFWNEQSHGSCQWRLYRTRERLFRDIQWYVLFIYRSISVSHRQFVDMHNSFPMLNSPIYAHTHSLIQRQIRIGMNISISFFWKTHAQRACMYVCGCCVQKRQGIKQTFLLKWKYQQYNSTFIIKCLHVLSSNR